MEQQDLSVGIVLDELDIESAFWDFKAMQKGHTPFENRVAHEELDNFKFALRLNNARMRRPEPSSSVEEETFPSNHLVAVLALLLGVGVLVFF